MCRYDVLKEEDRLTLALPIERRLMMAGCPLFLFASACLLVLGFLTIATEAHSLRDHHAGDVDRLFNPHVNQFGFLWLVACLLIAGFVPIYAYLVRKYSMAYCFDLSKGAVLKYGRPVTWLSRIEYLKIRRTRDPDDFSTYTLLLVHNDGYELVIDDSNEEPQIRLLAEEIAEFTGVHVVRPAVRVG